MKSLGIALLVGIVIVTGSMAALQMKAFEDTIKIQDTGTWSYVAGKDGQTYVTGPNNQTYVIRPSSRQGTGGDGRYSAKTEEADNTSGNPKVNDSLQPALVSDLNDYTPSPPTNIQSNAYNFGVNWNWSKGFNSSFTEVSVNGTFKENSTDDVYNFTEGIPHGTYTIQLREYNNTQGAYSSWANQTTTIPNNRIIITNVSSSYSLNEGQTLYIDADYFDADYSDTGTFADNSDKWDVDSSTGVVLWTTKKGDSSVYNWQITVSDGYDPIAIKSFTVTVSSSTPGKPNLVSSTGNFWVRYNWSAGANTDSFNVSFNGTWTNGSSATFIKETVGPHGWGNITVYGWNNSLKTLGPGESQSTQVPNNAPLQAPIGAKTVTETSLLELTVSATDAELDPITYSTNATKGTFNNATGQFSWNTSYGDNGVYFWSFSSRDNYGGVASETITVTVNDVPLSIVSSLPPNNPTTTVGTPQTFSIELNRTANVTWYIDGYKDLSVSNVKSSGYTNSTAGVSGAQPHDVTAIAADGYDSVSRTWFWSVTGGNGTVHNLDTKINYETIQKAIDDASDGHTITVDPGTYNENVNVWKQLTIRSTSGNPAGTIVQAGNPNDHVFEVTAPYVNISGFTVKGAKDTSGTKIAGIYLGSNAHHSNISNNGATENNYGIYLDSSNNNMLNGNIVSNNQGGDIFCIPPFGCFGTPSGYGIWLQDSSNNTLSGNTANSNKFYGIYLTSSNNNTLADNTASSNKENGIYLKYSSKNILTNNKIDGNKYNFRLDVNSDSNSDNQINTSNLVDGKPIYYVKDAANTIYDSSTNAGTFYCISCVNVTIKDLNLNKNGAGIFFWNTSSSRIQNVTVQENEKGIYLESSSNNQIYNNNFISNPTQANVTGGSGNILNLTIETGGNYWSDYTGTDANSDGIGDTPYTGIGGAGGKDWYPFMQRNGWRLPRALSIKINDGADYTDSPNVTLNLSASDAAERMSFINSDSNTCPSNSDTRWSAWEPVNTSKSWTLTSGNGKKTVCFKAGNSVGEAAPVKDDIILDIPTISINNGANYTNSTSVTLALSSARAKEMRFSNDNISWTDWEAFATTKPWTLTSGEGKKTVYFKVRNDTESEPTKVFFDEITLDTTNVAVTNLSASPSTPVVNRPVNITANVSDTNLNTSNIFASIGYPKGDTKIYQMTDSGTNGTYYHKFNDTSQYGRYDVVIIASDLAGNTNSTEKTWFVTTILYENNSINTIANNVTVINAPKVNTTLELVTSSNTSGTIKITMSSDIPPEIDRSFALTPFGKYISINASIINNLTWIKLKFYYTEAELDASGLDESSLKISWYNESANPKGWELLSTGSPGVYGTGVETADTNGYAGYVWVNMSHLSLFGILGEQKRLGSSGGSSGSGGSSSGGGGSSSSGGGGGGASGEDYANIEVKEQYDLHIFKDKMTSYRFSHSRNPITYVNITGNVNAGEINVAVEVLRKTSTLIKPPTPAPGIVYKNVNIWVGTSGFAVPKNIQTAAIKFKVANSWLDGNKVAAGDLKMAKWDGRKWVGLETKVKEKDGNNTYFEATTNSFSPLAITGLKGIPEAAQTSVLVNSTPAPTESVRTYVLPVETPTEKTNAVPGYYYILIVLAIAIAVYILGRRIK